MLNDTIAARGHTTRDGTLTLSVNVGVPDTDVAVTMQVKSLAPVGEVDANGWPKGFFECVAGSMPELHRARALRFAARSNDSAE